MMKEFPSRQWKRSALNDLVDKSGNADKQPGSGQLQSVCMSNNVAIVAFFMYWILCNKKLAAK